MSVVEKIALTKIKGIGPKYSRLLLAYFGNVVDLFSSSSQQLNAIPGLNRNIVQQIKSKACFIEAEAELRHVEKHGIDLLWIEDNDYPKRLVHCEDAPMLLYSYGRVDYNAQKVVSIVGTRNATAYGKRIIEELVDGLKEAGVLIVSGLAMGIDVLVHLASVRRNIPNIAVLGHGLSRIYPSQHRDLSGEIINNGALLTEFAYQTQPDKSNFPMRNRIIAGLSDATIVVEAGEKGGALITARLANEYNRDVCAFPGAIDQPYSSGCNRLIKDNEAHLIRNSQDLLNLMQWQRESDRTAEEGIQLTLIPNFTDDQRIIYDFLKSKKEASVDDISCFSDWPQSKLAVVLLEMEMAGYIYALPGKIYKML
ncbi:DNA-protecting protein DprA [Sphingobacterium sp. DK4209]|uniref:DNA-protecting protein DprA n=1 Tax=Sphingobacterium zhuxiongii TaxID=2662364 RepID=A0A5Q0Q6Z5_9SPHI|nr:MULTISPECIES: DNA-processing protein DprA [unclassified Sphingobacterium]MVZ64902.1 DNA-protecting protein DprA [Sphingobacterium sp. DK4209]QGA25243.1 DNA-protecting protein DprA [Sphingobacterium sp. dk4302]